MRAEKKQMVDDIGRMLSASKYVFFVSYKGLTVKDFSNLRTDLAKGASECHVFKNRLIKKAAELNGIKALSDIRLKDDTAVVTGRGDVGVVAKILSDFAKGKDKLAPKCGYLDGSVLSANDIKAISTLPSKDVLRSQLLGVLQAPSRNLANVLYAKLCQIVNVLNNYKEQKEKVQ
jgi:large subunit ribosomal protein L10